MTQHEITAYGIEVTQQEAKDEIEWSGASWEEFTAEFGIHDTYDGEEVLAWLGF